MKQGLCIALIIFGLQAAPTAAKAPLPVSPGAGERSLGVDARCPTFSWGSVRAAGAYEVIVFEVGEDVGPGVDAATLADTARLAFWTEIPGPALTWTPASDRCLERGRSYAWFVRAIVDGANEPWSEARFFEVREAPSLEEVEEALDTLRRYVGGSGEADRADLLAALAGAADTGAASETPTGPPEAGPMPAFDVAITGQPVSAGNPTIGAQGVTDSPMDQSAGVVGQATATMGISDGVRGASASTSGTGVRGSATSLTGLTAGVWGGASSPAGFGGFFFNLGLGNPGGTGLYASGALNSSPDLIVAGNLFWPEANQDDGRIHSDPLHPSSDLILQSNDFVQIELDADGDGENADFTVVDKDHQVLFNVDSDGTTFVLGDLTITGNPQGGLVSISEVQQLVEEGIQDHLAAEHPRIVFVTSQTYDGDLGGLSGADAKCAARALTAGLLGTFKAWISGSSNTEEARDRMSQADVPYMRVDNVKVADNWADLIDGSLDAPINVNENGNTVVNFLTAYTNTDSDGTIHETGRECGLNPGNEWNTNDMFASGGYGTVGATNSTWSWVTNNACDNLRRLYCVQQ